MVRRVVAIVWVLGLIVAGLFVMRGRQEFYAQLPKERVAGIGIRYAETATKPWAGIETALETIVFVMLDVHGPQGYKLTERMVVQVLGPDDMIVGRDVEPTGTVRLDGPPLGPEYITIVVRQLVRDGRIQPACVSALHHEYAEHVYPHRLRDDLNLGHEDASLTVLGERMQNECGALVEAGGE